MCAWELGLQPALNNREIAIDPIIGRIVLGVETADEGNALLEHLLLSYTYGAVGPVGAHPISRLPAPQEWKGETVEVREVNFYENANGLQDALTDIQDSTSPILIVLNDSMTHELDLSAVGGTKVEDGGPNLMLNRTLIIRAADNQRPSIKVAQPLRFRPTNVKGSNKNEQKQFDAVMGNLTVQLEGLYLTRGDTFPAGEPLIARAALHSLEIISCTLDPGGFEQLDGTRAAIQTSMNLKEPYGFGAAEEKAFNQTPEVILQRTISGPLFIDSGYLLFLTDSIIDAGSGVGEDPAAAELAVSGNGANPAKSWGPPAQVEGITVFGRMRVESINGRGGIWAHTLEVLDNQTWKQNFGLSASFLDNLPTLNLPTRRISASGREDRTMTQWALLAFCWKHINGVTFKSVFGNSCRLGLDRY